MKHGDTRTAAAAARPPCCRLDNITINRRCFGLCTWVLERGSTCVCMDPKCSSTFDVFRATAERAVFLDPCHGQLLQGCSPLFLRIDSLPRDLWCVENFRCSRGKSRYPWGVPHAMDCVQLLPDFIISGSERRGMKCFLFLFSCS